MQIHFKVSEDRWENLCTYKLYGHKSLGIPGTYILLAWVSGAPVGPPEHHIFNKVLI